LLQELDDRHGPLAVLLLTTTRGVVINDNMKACLIEKSRTVINDTTFFEVGCGTCPTRFEAARTRLSIDWPSL